MKQYKPITVKLQKLRLGFGESPPFIHSCIEGPPPVIVGDLRGYHMVIASWWEGGARTQLCTVLR